MYFFKVKIYKRQYEIGRKRPPFFLKKKEGIAPQSRL